MKNKIPFFLVAVVSTWTLLGCSNPSSSENDTTINIAAIPGVTVPVNGATPVTTITDTAQYTGIVSWSGTPAAFEASTEYTATITLEAKAGYTLDGVTANFFTVEGASLVRNSANSGIVTAIFPSTGAATVTSINIAEISGVKVPVTGATPVTVIAENTQYDGTVSWSGTPTTFAAFSEYTATITLTAKTGYTLDGVAANFFSVAGATIVTNNSNSGVVTAVFPTTMGEDYISSNIGTLKYIPAGSFQRDTTATNISVITQPYRMSEYEITRAQFLSIVGTDPSSTVVSSSISDPVQKVNWYHAIAFCNKLSLDEGLTPVYSISVGGTPIDWETLTFNEVPLDENDDWNAVTANWSANGYRLPTEMEWFWAAMGATRDSQPGAIVGGINRTGYAKPFAGYNGNNSIGDYTWYSTNSGNKTNPVASKLPNELGLYHMTGNVWEWCWDWHDFSDPWPNYPCTGTQTDYRGPDEAANDYRTARGGGFPDDESGCIVAYRSDSTLYSQGDETGFRVVRP